MLLLRCLCREDARDMASRCGANESRADHNHIVIAFCHARLASADRRRTRESGVLKRSSAVEAERDRRGTVQRGRGISREQSQRETTGETGKWMGSLLSSFYLFAATVRLFLPLSLIVHGLYELIPVLAGASELLAPVRALRARWSRG